MKFWKAINLKINKKPVKKPKTWKQRFHKVYKKITGDTVGKRFFRLYFITILIGACFLYMPFSLNPGWTYIDNQYVWFVNGKIEQQYNFFDAIFFASSSFSDTGIVPLTTSYVFSIPGQIILILLIQFGGLGFLAIIIIIWKFLTFKSKLTFEQRLILHSERGNNKYGTSYKIVYFGFLVVIIAELIGWFALTFFFYYQKPSVPVNPELIAPPSFAHQGVNSYYHNWGLATWAALFHTVSAVNNAGFDILGSLSIAPFRNDTGAILSVVIFFELIIGGIGYPIFYDCYLWIKAKRKKQHFRFSLFSKLAVLSYFLVGLIGMALILIFEMSPQENKTALINQNPSLLSPEELSKTDLVYGWGHNVTANKTWSLIFSSFSARSAGFASINMSHLTTQSKWLVSVLMFIGASPASTGGGIRTITLFIIISALISRAMGRKYLSIFKRTIHRNLISESSAIFVVALVISFISVLIILVSAPVQLHGDDVFFEVFSALGTTGYTSGVTGKSSIIGRIPLIVLMFVGQLGVSTTLTSWTKKHPTKQLIRYQYEDIRVN